MSDATHAPDTDFDAPVRTLPIQDPDAFVVELNGYAGPLDILLDLARRQKVDLRQISVLALVDQYLHFIEDARRGDLDLAAEYLVMAAWLTFLKSRLLLPTPPGGADEPSADELSAQLAFQLQRLDAMRQAADALQALPQLGRDIFARGRSTLQTETHTEWSASLYDLLKAYATQRVRAIDPVVREVVPEVFAIETARARLHAVLSEMPDWCLLSAIEPQTPTRAPARSVIASTFGAALELARGGVAEIRQSRAFAPVYIRKRLEEGPA